MVSADLLKKNKGLSFPMLKKYTKILQSNFKFLQCHLFIFFFCINQKEIYSAKCHIILLHALR